jgi:protein-disulfide isomerase
VSEFGSAPVPEPGDEDHLRRWEAADRPAVILYADFECPFCAALHVRLEDPDRPAVRIAFRHFPVRSSHPRAWPAACAAEAAGRQGRFWEMHDALFADTARLEDPHLWDRAQALGLDLDRFEADRHGDAVRERIKRDFRSGVRAGVVTTPTAFMTGSDGTFRAVPGAELESRLARV